MASSLEVNKMLAAVLTAGIIASGAGVISRIIYHPHVPGGARLPDRGGGDRGRAPRRRRPRPRSACAALLAAGQRRGGPDGRQEVRRLPHLRGGRRQQDRPDAVGRGRPRHRRRSRASPIRTLWPSQEGAWDYENLGHFLADPKGWAPGTKMTFAGLKKRGGSRRRDPLSALALARGAAVAGARGRTGGRGSGRDGAAQPRPSSAAACSGERGSGAGAGAAAGRRRAAGADQTGAQPAARAGRRRPRRAARRGRSGGGREGGAKCAVCHSFEEGGAAKLGPTLWGVVGRDIASVDGLQLLDALTEKEGSLGLRPARRLPRQPEGVGARHQDGFAGIRKPDERADIIAYLRSLADSPAPLPAAAEPAEAARPWPRAEPAWRVRGLRPPAGRCRGRGRQRRYFRTPVSVETKPDASPVTIADREAEAAMRELIRGALSRPRHRGRGVRRASGADAEFVWVLDPIDGTKSFITGRPLFGTLIALSRARPPGARHDRPVHPARALGRRRRPRQPAGTAGRSGCGLARALERGGAVRDHAADVPRRRRARRVRARPAARALADVRRRLLRLRPARDGLCRPGRRGRPATPHDFMALVPVIEGAGGVMTDWQGRPLTAASAGQVVAAGDPPGPRGGAASCWRRPARLNVCHRSRIGGRRPLYCDQSLASGCREEAHDHIAMLSEALAARSSALWRADRRAACRAGGARGARRVDVRRPQVRPDFTHFDYVNPDAPKGGTLVLSAIGTLRQPQSLHPQGHARGRRRG